MQTVHVWTDGACSGNPGPGGWAAILQAKGHAKAISGRQAHATSNEMELEAVRQALLALTKPCAITLHTDSTNVIRWLTLGAKKETPEHVVYLLTLVTSLLESGHTLTIEKAQAHANDDLNNRCDELAKAEVVTMKLELAQAAQEAPAWVGMDQPTYTQTDAVADLANAAYYDHIAQESA
jgi:ribonuclease HI